MRVRPFFVALTAGILLFGVDVPVRTADAALAGGTTATITIDAGPLSISVPAGPISLGSAVNAPGGSSVTGLLGEVTVTDSRSGVAGWVASVISGAFTPATGTAISALNVSYAFGTITPSGLATITGTNEPDLTAAVAVMTATAVTGDNTATWNPSITVAIAQGTTPGIYTATITHSLV